MMKLLRAAVTSGLLLTMLVLPVCLASAAEAGGALFQARCAQCHGKNGEGKTGVKAPSLMSAQVRNMSDDELKAIISQRANGEMERKSSHTLVKKRLTADQVEAIVAYIREMQSR